jgi:hypothetical protein
MSEGISEEYNNKLCLIFTALSLSSEFRTFGKQFLKQQGQAWKPMTKMCY